MMGSMPKLLYVPTTYRGVVSRCLGSHHHILMPDAPNKFLICISLCFILQTWWHDDMLLKCNTGMTTIHHFKNGRTCSCFIWGSNLSSKLFPFVLQVLQWWVSSQNFVVVISSEWVPVYLGNYLPSSLLLSSPGNGNMLLNSLLNGAEAFFFIFHQTSVPLSLSHLHAQGIIVCVSSSTHI